MSDTIKHLNTLANSPFLCMPILQTFFINFPEKEKSILLAYLVLPLSLSEKSRENLAKNSKKRNLSNFSLKHENITNLPEKLENYKKTTNIALHQLISQELLTVNNDLSVRHCDDYTLPILPNFEKSNLAAKNLANLLSPYEIPVIFKKLGIYKL